MSGLHIAVLVAAGMAFVAIILGLFVKPGHGDTAYEELGTLVPDEAADTRAHCVRGLRQEVG